MADWGIKISQPGVDVRSATPSQLYFSSKYDSWKIKTVAQQTVTLNTGNTNQTYSYAHGLSYVPAFFCLAGVGGGLWAAAPIYIDGNYARFGSLVRIYQITAYIDGTNLNVRLDGTAPGANESIDIKYYIFYNQID